MVTGQLADATGDFACLVFVLLAASARPRVVQSASWRIRELSSYRCNVFKVYWNVNEDFIRNLLPGLKVEEFGMHVSI